MKKKSKNQERLFTKVAIADRVLLIESAPLALVVELIEELDNILALHDFTVSREFGKKLREFLFEIVEIPHEIDLRDAV